MTKPSIINGRLLWSNGADLGAVSKDVDGYYVWWPKQTGGCWPAYALRAIADQLDEINAPWDAEVQGHFDKELTAKELAKIKRDKRDEIHRKIARLNKELDGLM
jgi:hypothetical protein